MFAIEEGSLGDLIVGPEGLIAAGCVAGPVSYCERRILVVSSDGVTWQEQAIDTQADVLFGSLRVVGQQIFSLGYGHYGLDGGAVIQTSVDGRTWTRVESGSFRERAVVDVIGSPSGAIAIGYVAPIDSDNTKGFVTWPVGTDGAFGTARLIDVTDGPVLVTAGMWTGQEFLAWGVRDGPLGVGPTALLASPDGVAWSVRGELAAGNGGSVAQIVVVGDRLIAVGYEGRRYPIAPHAWTSTDGGRSWRLATVPSDNAAMAAVAVEGSVLIARGGAFTESGSQRGTVSWTSTDGTAWTRLDDDEDMPAVFAFDALLRATLGDRICVAGTIYTETSSRAAIYCRTTAGA
jgi:hypothetical protein